MRCDSRTPPPLLVLCSTIYNVLQSCDNKGIAFSSTSCGSILDTLGVAIRYGIIITHKHALNPHFYSSMIHRAKNDKQLRITKL